MAGWPLGSGGLQRCRAGFCPSRSVWRSSPWAPFSAAGACRWPCSLRSGMGASAAVTSALGWFITLSGSAVGSIQVVPYACGRRAGRQPSVPFCPQLFIPLRSSSRLSAAGLRCFRVAQRLLSACRVCDGSGGLAHGLAGHSLPGSPPFRWPPEWQPSPWSPPSAGPRVA